MDRVAQGAEMIQHDGHDQLAGQLIMSIVLDHFGALGYPIHPVNGWRLVGVGLLMVGAYLIKRF